MVSEKFDLEFSKRFIPKFGKPLFHSYMFVHTSILRLRNTIRQKLMLFVNWALHNMPKTVSILKQIAIVVNVIYWGKYAITQVCAKHCNTLRKTLQNIANIAMIFILSYYTQVLVLLSTVELFFRKYAWKPLCCFKDLHNCMRFVFITIVRLEMTIFIQICDNPNLSIYSAIFSWCSKVCFFTAAIIYLCGTD